MACSAITTEAVCTASMSCNWTYETGTCAGTPTGACSDATTQADCQSGLGCHWATSPYCAGNSAPCSAITNQSGCAGHVGCSWRTTIPCSGAPTPCAQMSVAQCTAQPGCTVER
jgi:hypothetical protein